MKVQLSFDEKGSFTLDCIVSMIRPDGTIRVDSADCYINENYDKESRDPRGNRITFKYKGEMQGRKDEAYIDANNFVELGRPLHINIYRSTIITKSG